jgi:hypothetical protein
MYPDNILRLLYKTCGLYENKIAQKNDIVHWRNDSIAHGALKLEDSDEYLQEFECVFKYLKDYFGNDGITDEDPLHAENQTKKILKVLQKKKSFRNQGIVR